ncbi:MAG: rhomboid family intramembrane serine protease [Opitutales bacterium]|nr:rhomboid family intramembrane serine protease [Opitutales bacterium]
MIQDRDYFSKRESAPAEAFSAIKLITIINAAVFAANALLLNFFNSDVLARYFSLSLSALGSGKIWTLLTYSFLHGGFLHLGVNLLILWLVCGGFERDCGAGRTLFVYFASVLGGGLAFLAVSAFAGMSHLVGASAGVAGLMAARFFLMENKKSLFALFGVFPIAIRPRAILYVVAACEFFGMVFVELAPYSAGGGIGYSSHLGGMAFGVLCAMAVSGKFRGLAHFGKIKRPRGMGRASDYKFKVNISDDAELRRRTDEILDKIKEKGFHTLTDEEKRVLDIAKDRL